MLFHTVAFSWFLLIVVVLALGLPRALLLTTLLVASYVFYGFSGPGFVLLLIATSIADYSLARAFEHRSTKARRLGIVLSALGNFSVLGYFKYSNFVLSSLNPMLVAAGVHGPLPLLDLVLPVGVSFYTFQSFAYTVDVLTGKIAACRSLPRFLLFVSWFPQLVAGPIMRAADLLPPIESIEQRIRGMAERVPAAALLFAEGWLRKAFADLVAPASDAFFSQPAASTSAAALYGIVAFGLQIYGDFSGYTRMAQGASWLFGVPLMENFDLPYASRSVREFWRRWHISLSTWFRDYVYIPLGGNRKGVARTYFNLIVTMLLCGLWHGANWTFIVWGALHATVLVGERALAAWGRLVPRSAARPLTLAFVFLAWVPFRAPDIAGVGAAYAALFHGGWQRPTLPFLVGTLGIVLIDVLIARRSRPEYARLEAQPAAAAAEWRTAAFVAICVLTWGVARMLGAPDTQTFIYFQF